MFLRAWRRWRRSSVPSGRAARRRPAPGLERLEERVVPATIELNPSLATRFQDGPVQPLTQVSPGLYSAANLRSAVAGAKALPGANTILLESATYSLRGDLFGGDLSISNSSGGSLTIQNESGSVSVIDAGQHSRIFDVTAGSTAVLNGLQLQNGLDFSGTGGAVLNEGDLTVNNCVLASNTEQPGAGSTAEGGAIADASTATGLDVSFSTIRDNKALGGAGDPTFGFAGDADGGGIFGLATVPLTVLDCTVQGNLAMGGATAATGTGSPLGGAAAGGGLFLAGADVGGTAGPGVSITGSTFALNVAAGGNAIGDATFGGIAGGGAGGGLSFSGQDGGPPLNISVVTSTFSANQARGGNGSGGSAVNPSQGGNARGGGLSFQGTVTATLVNDTATLNSIAGGTGTTAATVGGGGAQADSSAVVRLLNTIVAQDAGTQPDLSGAFVSLGHNLIGDATGGAGLVNGVHGDRVGGGANPVLNAGLAPLADNGGPTPTHALTPGGPALDQGDAAVLAAPYNLSTDQRGFSRSDAAGEVDIGAFEFQDDSLTITVAESGPPVTTGGTATITITVANAGTNALPADGSTVTVTLPAGLALVPGAATTFPLGALPAGHGALFTTQATATAPFPTALTVTAGVTSPDTSPNTVQTSGLLDVLSPQQRFIQALYREDLGRYGSLDELNSWLPTLNGPNGQEAVAADIQNSFEAEDRLVRGLYQAYLGRQAQGGEELGWVGLLQAGQTEETVEAGILSSVEFYNRAQGMGFGGTPDQDYVQALYQVLLGRSASAGEVSGWTAFLPTLGRQGVALDFLFSAEYRTDLVVGDYGQLLHRPASAAEVNGWAASGLNAAGIQVGMQSSPEFYTNG